MAEQRFIGWGYEGKTLNDLLETAAQTRAYAIVGIRKNAISRKKGFSKTRLREAVESAGLTYVHLRSLGKPKDNRAAFSKPGTPMAEAAHSRFETEILKTHEGQLAIHTLANLAESGPIILLCYESDHSQCHRSLVVDAVKKIRSA